MRQFPLASSPPPSPPFASVSFYLAATLITRVCSPFPPSSLLPLLAPLPSLSFPFSPFPFISLSVSHTDSFEMHCPQSAVARAANANPISENNFSRRRILARLFKKTLDLTLPRPPKALALALRHPNRTPFHPSSLRLCRPLFYAAGIPPPLPTCSCSATVVPAHFLRTTFKTALSFLAIKECPRSFAVTYGRAGNNDKR